MALRKGGIIQVQYNGVLLETKGNWTYNLGRPKRDTLVGSNAVHGFTETPQVAFIEGEITDDDSVDLAALLTVRDATVTLALANGKTVVLRNAWQAGEGTGNTQEGNISVRFEAKSGDEV